MVSRTYQGKFVGREGVMRKLPILSNQHVHYTEKNASVIETKKLKKYSNLPPLRVILPSDTKMSVDNLSFISHVFLVGTILCDVFREFSHKIGVSNLY